MNGKRWQITDSDRCRLGSLLTSRECRAWGNSRCLSKLNTRLERADTIAEGQARCNVVTMNSTSILTDLASGKHRQVTLTYPQDCEFFRDSVSVFDPLGLALLGSAVGDTVSCGRKQFRVTSVIRK